MDFLAVVRETLAAYAPATNGAAIAASCRKYMVPVFNGQVA